MNVHFHSQQPMYCIETTSWGWAVAAECVPEKVEPCSEQVVGDIWLAPNLGALFTRLEEAGVRGEDIEELKSRIAEAARAR